MTATAQREKAKKIAAEVNSVFGKGAIQLGSDSYFNVEYLPTGIAPIDDLLQGGIPYGRFIEIFGDYSTLKTYVGLKAIAECQKRGGLAALIDTEHSFDPKWAKECGVDLEQLVLKQPENGEKAMDLVEVLIRGGVDLIVFDSIAATLPKAEQETMLSGDKNIQPARLASLMSLAMRKLTAANKKTAMIWINQTRLNVGVMFGNPETVPGGKAMGFYASMRISLRKAGKVTEDVFVFVNDGEGRPKRKKIKRTVAQNIRATLEKSKLNVPYRDVEFQFDFKTGTVDNWWYLVTQALDVGLIEYNRGVWECPKGKFRGREAFQTAMGEKEMLSLLGVPSGNAQPAKTKAGAQKKNGRVKTKRDSIPVQGQGGSKKTRVIKRQRTK